MPRTGSNAIVGALGAEVNLSSSRFCGGMEGVKLCGRPPVPGAGRQDSGAPGWRSDHGQIGPAAGAGCTAGRRARRGQAQPHRWALRSADLRTRTIRVNVSSPCRYDDCLPDHMTFQGIFIEIIGIRGRALCVVSSARRNAACTETPAGSRIIQGYLRPYLRSSSPARLDSSATILSKHDRRSAHQVSARRTICPPASWKTSGLIWGGWSCRGDLLSGGRCAKAVEGIDDLSRAIPGVPRRYENRFRAIWPAIISRCRCSARAMPA